MRGFKEDIDNLPPNWGNIAKLIPYLLEFKSRLFIAISCLVAAKASMVFLPVLLKYIVDSIDTSQNAFLVVPMALLLAYGSLRFASVLFGELRDSLFGRITERTMRRIGLTVFNHLHKLDLDFHLSRRTGGLSRDIERGVSGISFVMRFMVFNIIPTLIEILLIAVILASAFKVSFAVITLGAVALYITYSVVITEWRNKYIRLANKADNQSNTRAIDSLLNYETVKYFNNEHYEANNYDNNLAEWEKARMKNRLSLAGLNIGQALIISGSMTIMLILAAQGVVNKEMTLGDFVLVNAYLMQLFIPLNFLGFVYREIRQSLTHIERMFMLLDKSPSINDKPDAKPLNILDCHINFNDVDFAYNEERQILKGVNFTINSKEKVAIVGPSGSGKSTIARLLFRFYDVNNGSITIDDQDLRDITQQSLRQSIGVVPQDTVLFNETIEYNIRYGNPDASQEDINQAATLAHLSEFIEKLPEGYNTVVGERGLKLSGGEKQRIAIARTLLKNPDILLFDEATSSLDSNSEQAIMAALNEISKDKTTISIAHRLSTIVDSDRIIVLNEGEIQEQGTHQELLAQQGLYAELWQRQSESSETHNPNKE